MPSMYNKYINVNTYIYVNISRFTSVRAELSFFGAFISICIFRVQLALHPASDADVAFVIFRIYARLYSFSRHSRCGRYAHAKRIYDCSRCAAFRCLIACEHSSAVAVAIPAANARGWLWPRQGYATMKMPRRDKRKSVRNWRCRNDLGAAVSAWTNAADPTCSVRQDFGLLNIQFCTSADIKYERQVLETTRSRQKYQFTPSALFFLLLLKNSARDCSNISFRIRTVTQICHVSYCFTLMNVMDESNGTRGIYSAVIL